MNKVLRMRRGRSRFRERIAYAFRHAHPFFLSSLFFIRTRSHGVKGMYVRYVSMDYSNEVRTRSRHIRARHASSAVSLNRNLLSRANILNHLCCAEIGRIRENFNKARARAHTHMRGKKFLRVFRSFGCITNIGNFICRSSAAKRELKLFKQCGRSQSKYYRFRYHGYVPRTVIK